MVEPQPRSVSITWKRLAMWQWSAVSLLATLLVWFVTNERATAFSKLADHEKRLLTLEQSIAKLPTLQDMRELLDDQFGPRGGRRYPLP